MRFAICELSNSFQANIFCYSACAINIHIYLPKYYDIYVNQGNSYPYKKLSIQEVIHTEMFYAYTNKFQSNFQIEIDFKVKVSVEILYAFAV